MKRTKLLTALSITLVAFTGVTGAAQAHKVKPGNSLDLTLDAYEPNNDGFAGAVVSKKLPYGSKWVAEVKGTVSYYNPSEYVEPTSPFRSVCGVPDPAGILFASPDKPSYNTAGQDPEFLISRPWRKKQCTKQLPVRTLSFQIDSGRGFKHPWVLGPALTGPTLDHAYGYPVNGYGGPAAFRLKDRPRTSDNYGLLKIHLRPATAADCGNADYRDYWAFDYADQAQCEAALGGAPASTLN